MDADHAFQAFFPDPYYAVAIPLVLLVVGITGISTLIALVMVKADKGKKPAATESKKQK